MATKFVAIKLPDSDAVGSCPERAFPYWAKKGWVAVDPADAPDVASTQVVTGQADVTPTNVLEGTAEGESADGAKDATAGENADNESDKKPARGGRRPS